MIMYLGPNIPGLVKKNQIYGYDPTDIKQKAAAINPLTRYMFVTLDDSIAEKRRELATQGTLLNISYRNILKGLN